MTIVAATPCRDSVSAMMAWDLTQMLNYENSKPYTYDLSHDVVWAIGTGSLLPNLRHQLVQGAISGGYSHILFLDSDMRFPKDTVSRLLAHKDPIVGANYRARTGNHDFVARKNGKVVQGSAGSDAVDLIGLGVCLIDMDVFLKVQEPWFGMPWDGQRYIGEDVFFFHKAKSVGYSIVCDHDLSREVKHISEIELSC